jgi:hypothetical protein
MQQHVVLTDLASWRCCTGVLACTTLASLLALAGATISIALVSLPCFASIIALGVLASVQLQRCLQHVLVHSIVLEFVPCSNGNKLGVAGLVVPVVVFIPVNVLIVFQSSERLSWAPLASLHY